MSDTNRFRRYYTLVGMLFGIAMSNMIHGALGQSIMMVVISVFFGSFAIFSYRYERMRVSLRSEVTDDD